MGESPDLKPSVEKPVQRVRVGFVIGLAIVMTVGITVPLVMRMRGPDVDLVETTTAPYTLDPHCTPLGARRYLAETKLPLEAHAVCLALAGSTDDARSILRAMPTDTRGRAIAQIFGWRSSRSATTPRRRSTSIGSSGCTRRATCGASAPRVRSRPSRRTPRSRVARRTSPSSYRQRSARAWTR